MVRGFYEAASGVLAQQRNFNVISNNIANATTTGYKAESLIGSSFAQHLIARVGDGLILPRNNIGSATFFTTNIDEYTDFAQGSIENTGRDLDFALVGDGFVEADSDDADGSGSAGNRRMNVPFFMIESESMGEVLTRNGQFGVDSEMNLILPGVGLVLDDGGSPITLESSAITVDANGVVRYADGDGEEVARIGVYSVEDTGTLENAGRGFYRGENADVAAEGSYRLEQYAIEKANVNTAMEMSRVMAGQNLYNACTQVVKMYDQLNETLVTQIGRVS
ncbi:MAG: flagellar hook-basal body protein [Clostridiales Family XIII bacterium]|jgi:flagellar basal-body rod protein FlgG|nr:flagellar hook-basal body protein [Clostridiales Family XIII bacterium]